MALMRLETPSKDNRLTLKKTLCYREFPSSESFLFSTRNMKLFATDR
jgi:hypothetical protein